MGFLALAVLIILILAGRGKGGGLVPDKTDVPVPPIPPPPVKPGQGAIAGPPLPLPPEPKPQVFAKPKTTGGVAPAGGGNSLQISADCKTVTVGDTWWENRALPRAAELVGAGIGVNPYTAAQADRSLDAAVRTIVAESAGVACIDGAPWLDRWVKANPLPLMEPNDTREIYLAKLKAWDGLWDAKISAWAGSHPAMYELFKAVGKLVLVGYANALQVNPLAVGADGPAVPSQKANDVERAALRELGYPISPLAFKAFQIDYNMVQNFRTAGGWDANGLAIDEDDVVGPQTRDALAEALMLDQAMAGWPLIVETASREG